MTAHRSPSCSIRAVVAAMLVAAYVASRGEAVSAYEWQSGPGRTCASGYAVAVQAYVWGDWNLYTNYGLAGYEYNIPQTTLAYAFSPTTYNSVSSTAAEAGDAGGFVESLNTDCLVK